MTAKKKLDGRRNNGPADRGISQTARLVRCPVALAEAMTARAVERGISASEAWRVAARLWLALDYVVPVSASSPPGA